MKKEIIAAGVMGMVGGMLGSMLMNKPVVAQENGKEKSIRASSFLLEDKKGEVRAILGFNSNGNPILSLADENGQEVIGISATNKGLGIIRLRSKTKKYTSVGLTSTDIGGALVIRNKFGESVIELMPDKNGQGKIEIRDRKGKRRTLKPGN